MHEDQSTELQSQEDLTTKLAPWLRAARVTLAVAYGTAGLLLVLYVLFITSRLWLRGLVSVIEWGSVALWLGSILLLDIYVRIAGRDWVRGDGRLIVRGFVMAWLGYIGVRILMFALAWFGETSR